MSFQALLTLTFYWNWDAHLEISASVSVGEEESGRTCDPGCVLEESSLPQDSMALLLLAGEGRRTCDPRIQYCLRVRYLWLVQKKL
jgi:hypothetical protein